MSRQSMVLRCGIHSSETCFLLCGETGDSKKLKYQVNTAGVSPTLSRMKAEESESL